MTLLLGRNLRSERTPDGVRLHDRVHRDHRCSRLQPVLLMRSWDRQLRKNAETKTRKFVYEEDFGGLIDTLMNLS